MGATSDSFALETTLERGPVRPLRITSRALLLKGVHHI